MTPPAFDFDTIAARALNASRTVHKPTYAGLRILLQTLGNDKGAFEAFLVRTCQTRKDWRYFGFQIVKEAAKGKAPSFRNCVFGSPLTTLAEAHVLGLMAREPAFAVPPCAYSYQWPTEQTAGRNYEYFFEGYDRRNRAVAQRLTEHADAVALVTDVKSFYPSVQKDRLRAELARRCERVPDGASRAAIRQFALGLIDLSTPKAAGIPIGPDLSHALGHLALAPVDAALQARFGDRYFRYVDDIILVVPRPEVTQALQALRDALAVEGLALNGDKQDEVDAATWHGEAVSFTTPGGPEGFDALLDDVIAYLIRRPGEADDLHARFRDAGYSLPVGRLRSLAKSKRFRHHFRRKRGGWLGWFASWFTSQDTLLARAAEVRQALTAEAERLAGQAPPAGSQRRRWYVQKRRYVLNRLLYLYSPAEYRKVLDLTPALDEFFETRLVLESLSTGDCTTALGYPGRLVTTVCQLWPEHRSGTQPRVSWPAAPTRMDAEAAAHLALFLSVVPPEGFLRALDRHARGARMLIQMCGGGSADPAGIDRLSYLDELNLLYTSMPHEDVVRLISSRFDELEEVGLDGLMLGGATYLLPGDFPLFSG